jgi:hypothetical protein
MIVVFDTNVLVEAIFWPRSTRNVGTLLQLKGVKREAEWLRQVFAKHATLEIYE